MLNYASIPGWFYHEHVYDRLAELIQPGDRIVEIGSWMGRSSCYLGCKIKGRGVLFCVDTFDGSPTETPHTEFVKEHGEDYVYVSFLKNVWEFKLFDTILPIRATSHAATEYLSIFAPFRAVFVDGDHNYAAVKSDLEDYWPMIVGGGYLAGHDYRAGWEGVDSAVDEFCELVCLKPEVDQNCFLIRK